MAGRVDDYERTMAFADIALGQIKALRQFASPRNYQTATLKSGSMPPSRKSTTCRRILKRCVPKA
jgi:hypothetical protein